MNTRNTTIGVVYSNTLRKSWWSHSRGTWAHKRNNTIGQGLVIRHEEVIKRFLQGLLDIVTKYAKTVSGDMVAPVPEAHIVQTLSPSKADHGSRVGAFVLPTKRDYTTTKMDG